MSDRLGVLTSTRAVLDAAQHVCIDAARLRQACTQAAEGGVSVPPWNRTLHWTGDEEATAMYVFVLDALNFCFWGEPRWNVTYEGQELDGYWALAASLRQAIEEDAPILDASFLASIGEGELAHVLRGTTPIPLLAERQANLRELGRLLLDQYGGSVARLVGQARGDAVTLVHLVAEKLPSFNDVALYRGQAVRFYKRAQILAGDLVGSLDGRGLGALTGLHELTAFADYKLPQILRLFGVLVYEAGLAARIDGREPLQAGSEEEVEIRAHTVWAVELMRQELAAQGRSYLPHELDWWLWDASQRLPRETSPYHRTRTIYY